MAKTHCTHTLLGRISLLSSFLNGILAEVTLIGLMIKSFDASWRFCSEGERSTFGCSRKKPLNSENLFILPSLFHEQFWSSRFFINWWYFSMKFCLLVTVAPDIFVTGKSNTLHLLWICCLSFLHAKGVHSVRLSIEVSY